MCSKAQKIRHHPDLSKGSPEGAFQILFVVVAAAAHDAGDVVIIIIVVVRQEGVIIVVGIIVSIIDTGQQIIQPALYVWL